MSTPAGLLTPRGPFSGAAPLALRPLSAIAASAAGGVPESRIKRLLSDLLPSLVALHAQGEICGDISLETVGMDENARAHLLPELAVARSRRSSRTPAAGFAPFELYTDSMEWPRGPWSDIYSLCAVAYALVIGSRPPPAPERRAHDEYEALADMGLPKYSQEFLRVIDAGMSMDTKARPQSLAELASLLGVAAYDEPEAPEDELDEVAKVAPMAGLPERREPARRRGPLLFWLLILALIGAGVYAWFQWGKGTPNALITRSEVVQPNPPVVHPLPQTPPPAPPPAPAATQAPADLPSLTASGAASGQPAAAGSAATAAASSAGAQSNPASTAEAPPAPEVQEPAPPAATEEAPKPKPVPVTVRLDIRPWGEVWINGVARGISPPVKDLKLIPGKYQVVVRNADLPPLRMTLEVKPGKPAVISHTFQ
ncbi:serine/threonine protein kinase [Achromobacter sp. ACM05]|uniref:serine/threonine protein kinase n=1 Tax=Achromobacter sp. ACM05 TaxID=2854776 RepID=UPI001C455E84|nr:serine/threonine protein kinase [Achromobacter sp. ACM05]MBV7498951.1 serine/threonine protein kinase [Achromobacter sp. ACM05]